jgi:hypothetical protein
MVPERVAVRETSEAETDRLKSVADFVWEMRETVFEMDFETVKDCNVTDLETVFVSEMVIVWERGVIVIVLVFETGVKEKDFVLVSLSVIVLVAVRVTVSDFSERVTVFVALMTVGVRVRVFAPAANTDVVEYVVNNRRRTIRRSSSEQCENCTTFLILLIRLNIK